MPKFKTILSMVLRIGISIVLLVFLFKINKIDLGVLIDDMRGADKPLLAAGLAIYSLVYTLGFLRWRMLLQATGINIPVKRLIGSFSGGIFFSIFLPSTIGGDLVRTVDLAGHTRKTKEVIATVLLDRLSGYIGMIFLILPALLFGAGLVLDKLVLVSVSTMVILLAVGLLVLFNNAIYSRITRFLTSPGAGKIKEAISSMHREIHIFRNHKQAVILNLMVSFFIQFFSVLSVYFIGLALGIKISLIYYIIFLPIIGAITLLPIAIGGLGLREGLFVAYFAKVGVVKSLALAMSLLSFSFVIFYSAIGGLIYVLTVRYRRLQFDKPS
jgi:hypothetical protein